MPACSPKSYDALKEVDPGIRVIGLGLSGRGNDLPQAPSNASTSPVRFLRDLGAAYRASGRTLPLMDELGLHLYPRSDRDPVSAGDRWPRAGIVNVARIKQAFWDAFAGTGQPTVEQGLKLRIDEIGWQAVVPAARRDAYHGRETAAATSERAQADNYAKLIGIAACDRSISAVYLLHLRDDPDLERYQSGIRRADGSARPSYAAVRTAAARAKRGCAAKQVELAPRDPRRRRPGAVRARRGPRLSAPQELGLQRHGGRGGLVRRRDPPRERIRAGPQPRLAARARRRDDDRRPCPGRLEPAPALHVALPAAGPLRLCGAAPSEHERASQHRARQPRVRRPLAGGCPSPFRPVPRPAGPARPAAARSSA